MDEDKSIILDVVCISIGSYLIGSEYSAALGWGIWLIAIAIT